MLVFLIILNAKASYLPESWYTLPESNENQYKVDKFLEEELETPSPGVEKNYENLLNSMAIQFSYIRPQARSKFRLTNIRTSMGIGLKGLIGLSVAKGTSTMHLTWRKEGDRKSRDVTNKDDSDKTSPDNSFFLDEESFENGGVKEIESIMSLVGQKFKKRKSREKIRSKLKGKFYEMLNIALNLGDLDHSLNWEVEVARFDVGISAKGDVTSFITLGGGLNFRFEFKPVKRDQLKMVNMEKVSSLFSRSQLVRSEKISNLTSNLIEDLQTIGDDTDYNDQFYFNKIRIGFSESAKGDIGVVGLSGKVLGILHLRKKVWGSKAQKKLTPLKVTDGEYHYIVPYSKELEKFSKKNNLNYISEEQVHGITGFSPRKIVYRISRRKIRRSLQRSIRMAKFFTNVIERKRFKKWNVYKIENDFSLSVTGKVGLASLTHTALFRIGFEKESDE